ncbi:MAG: hypothetical protein N3E45_05925 [Oscillatoriaceae bacterium SKW80]|nr:hypothetical protein [Oscillatoriaceae bacterium SKYG93]MCX8120352.1 hypothetical protein [Oscillatoriaceae bacterium SKW80]MDW8453278.1 hypothetical protein [Oscillatoriaceae cyanobacterium SKYGB_i_bin93]
MSAFSYLTVTEMLVSAFLVSLLVFSGWAAIAYLFPHSTPPD